MLEINPDHPIINRLQEMFAADAENPKLTEWYQVLVDQSLLAEGSEVKDPASYVNRINRFLVDVLNKG